MKKWTKIKKDISNYLKQGLSPKSFAIAFSLGSVIGFFPVLGTTTIISGALALILRLNMAIIQIANYVVYPLQFLFIIPEIQIAHKLFFFHTNLLKINDFIVQLKHFDLEFIKHFSNLIIMAILGWIVISIPIFFIFFHTSKFLAQKYIKKLTPESKIE